ncbi:MAG: hypothetical protein LQ348_004778 [Seirophora lacunosa]|nr:MAG: hypothetical protein LQ344_007044 [Seirophora lacunosa]KAI4182924.1 MAG: hypothetical protein LQ348_004778 [Seirophora lacunosa]
MASAAVNLVAKKLLKEEAQKRLSSKQDPYFTTLPPKRKGGKPIKVKRSDTDVPPGLSPADIAILLKVRRRAYRLDNMMTLPVLHTKYGISALIGLLPVVGDFADLLLGLTVYNTCRKAGLDKATTSKMLFNIGLDGVLGLVPLLGDVADTLFRCNTRNLVELERFLTQKGLANLEKMRVVDDGHGGAMMEMEDTRGSPPPRYESRDGRGRVPGHGGRMESPSRAARGRVAGHGRRTESPTPQQQRVRAEASSRTNTGRSRRDDGRGERREGRAPALPARRDGSMF